MGELAKKDLPVAREEWKRADAVKFFESIGEKYKAEIIGAIPSEEGISLYREGDFIDLCRGPHVPSTGKLKVFKLMKVAGAYWRGDSKNEMLQRIYGTAWAKKEDQDAYLTMLEEAEKRDHRRIGKQLDLFHMQDEAPGMVFWHPKGWALWQQVEHYMRRVYRENGYQEIKCPMILDVSLWKKSGHWENYKENMFTTESEKRLRHQADICRARAGFQLELRSSRPAAALRRVPAPPSQRASGALHGLMRVRASRRTTATSSARPTRSSRMRGFPRARARFARFNSPISRSSSRCAREAHRATTRNGTGREAARRAARVRRAMGGAAGRGRVLGPKIEYHLKDSIGRAGRWARCKVTS